MAHENAPDLEPGGAEKKNEKQRLLLLVLLLLLALFAYLYFFTGMIKPREEAAKPEVPQTAQVKKPIPPRPEEKGEGTAPVKEQAPKPAEMKEQQEAKEPVAAKPVPPQAPAAKPQAEAPKKDSGAVKPEAKKPAAPAKAEQPAKPAEPKVAAKKEQPVPAKAVAQKPVPAPQAKAEKPADKPVAAKVAEKKPAAKAEPAPAKAGGAKAKAAKKPAATVATKGQFALALGEFVPDKAFLSLEKKLVKQGLAPLVKTKLQKPEPMNRLYVGEFSDYEQAAAGLAKLKKLTEDAFYLEKDGKYYLYAGSYHGQDLVAKETKRLSGKGVKVSVQKAEVPVAVVRLTAGSFSSREEAQKAAVRLKKQGLNASVVRRAP